MPRKTTVRTFSRADGPIKVGIAGLGRSGWSIHAAALSAPGPLQDMFRIVAVADPDAIRRDQAQAEHNCRTYTDAHLFAAPDGDVVAALGGTPVTVPLPGEPQGEAVALTGDADADTAELKRQMQLLLDASRAQYAEFFHDGAGEPWMPVALGGTAPTIDEADEIYARERAAREAKKSSRKR